MAPDCGCPPKRSAIRRSLSPVFWLRKSVAPPSILINPPDLWKELTGGEDYRPDTGEGLHRRSLYTFWKRASPPPSMMNFDAAGRETCVVREMRTNTPLQSLDFMNDQAYLEAAQGLAGRMIREGGETPADRISYGFRLARRKAAQGAELRYSCQFAYNRKAIRRPIPAAAEVLGKA